ncbi:MAG: creatininase family protein [Myxococcota bacterium]
MSPTLWALVLTGAARAQEAPLDAVRPIPAVDAVYLPDLTWMEVRDRLEGGATTVLVPTGGIEQNGPYLVLGKHDRIAREVAERAARELGDALVAPVVSFVPEGRIDPPDGHMRYAGTISVRPSTLEAVLEDTALSLAAHGFEHVVLVGDSWGNQDVQAVVAARLDGLPTRVHHLAEFYDPDAAVGFLMDRGLEWSPDDLHDDPAFTLQLAAIDPVAARFPQRLEAGVLVGDGFSIEPVDDRIALGEALLDWRARRTAEAVREARSSPVPSPWAGLREALLAPLTALTRPEERTHVAWLASSLLLAVLAVGWKQGRGASAGSVARAVFPREVWASRDAVHDLLFALCGGVFAFAWFGGTWAGLFDGAADQVLRMLRSTGIDGLGLTMGLPTRIAVTVVFVVVTDLAVWLAHYAQHRIPVLWAFHKVHHAAEHLTPLTVFRQHPVDLLLAGVLGSVLGGAAYGAFEWVSPDPPTGIDLFGLNVVLVAFYAGGYHLRHSHVWLSFGPLDRVFVSPAMHQIHHSAAPEHHGRNLGLTFSVWDQLFGTAWIPEREERLRFGIGPEGERFRTAVDFWVAPFGEILSGGGDRRDREDAREPARRPWRRESR